MMLTFLLKFFLRIYPFMLELRKGINKNYAMQMGFWRSWVI